MANLSELNSRNAMVSMKGMTIKTKRGQSLKKCARPSCRETTDGFDDVPNREKEGIMSTSNECSALKDDNQDDSNRSIEDDRSR